MEYLWFKSLHIIFMVSWFAGLLYMVRLFIYHREAFDKPLEEQNVLVAQFKIMEKRLWQIISWPAMLFTFAFGISMLINNPNLLKLPWMHIKLTLVIALMGYHFYLHYLYRRFQNSKPEISSKKLRMINEIGTLFLISIVFIVILKSNFNWIYGVIGFFATGVLFMILIKWYKSIRSKNH